MSRAEIRHSVYIFSVDIFSVDIFSVDILSVDILSVDISKSDIRYFVVHINSMPHNQQSTQMWHFKCVYNFGVNFQQKNTMFFINFKIGYFKLKRKAFRNSLRGVRLNSKYGCGTHPSVKAFFLDGMPKS